jgi:hypothetical protein
VAGVGGNAGVTRAGCDVDGLMVPDCSRVKNSPLK